MKVESRWSDGSSDVEEVEWVYWEKMSCVLRGKLVLVLS